MRRLFEEYSVLLLAFVCSIFGFDLIFRFFINGDNLKNIIVHLLYGVI